MEIYFTFMPVMRLYLIIQLFSMGAFCQSTPFKLIDTDIYKTDTITEKMLGQVHTFTRLTLNVKTRANVGCLANAPHVNVLHDAGDVIALSYVYDSTGALQREMLKEIKAYAEKMERMAKQYNREPDYTYLTYNQSFRYNNTKATPVIYSWVGSEENGDYMLYYVGNYFYKISLIDYWGEGSLSGFEQSNIRFLDNGEEIETGEYVKHVKKVKEILKAYK